jgi:hypothetical protein
MRRALHQAVHRLGTDAQPKDVPPRIVEYGCHEGNLTMPLTIKGLVAAKVKASAAKK